MVNVYLLLHSVAHNYTEDEKKTFTFGLSFFFGFTNISMLHQCLMCSQNHYIT